MTTSTVGQAGAEYLLRIMPGVEVEQAGVDYLLRVQPQAGVYQAGVEFLYKSRACNTQECQAWQITRKDGTIFRFTSLDRPLTWLGETWKSCDSLNPSASEGSDSADSVGSTELAGILSDSSVSEADLAAGRFDGARVEAWTVSWGPDGDGPRLIAQGNFGKATFGEAGWKVELLGDGVRLQQTPLLATYTPGCRWKHGGGFGGPECGKDLGPLTVSGTVTTGGERAFIDTTRTEVAGFFARGRVAWVTGANAGVEAEVRDHLDGGVIHLWPRLAAAIEVGDTYTMTPGCTYARDTEGGTNGCKDWGRILNYGGYPDVPGQDALNETPDVHQ